MAPACFSWVVGNVLILGGTSWLGHEIARVAVARDHDVTCFARGESGDVPGGAHLIAADREDSSAYGRLLDQRWDSVFELSWQPKFVRDAVRAIGHVASHWTYVSSVSVYRDPIPGGDESQPLHERLEAEHATIDDYAGAKVTCEGIVAKHKHALIARAGLIGGPGDRSDRFGYWISRFALAGDEPVLVPDVPDQPTQTIGVSDLAVWLVKASDRKVTGVFNVAGWSVPLGELLDLAAVESGFTGERVLVSAQWLDDHDVEDWMGPRSLPLWMKGDSGMAAQDISRAMAEGLVNRSLSELLAATLEFETAEGIDRERKAGLSRSEELELIDEARRPLESQ